MYYNFKIKASNLYKATEPGALYIEGRASEVLTVCFKPEVRIQSDLLLLQINNGITLDRNKRIQLTPANT